MIIDLLKKDNSLAIGVLFTTFMVAFIYGVNVHFVSILFGCLSLGICIYYLFNTRLLDAYFAFVIFASLSIEVGYFATGKREGEIVYSFLMSPFITTWGAFLLNVLLLIKLISVGAYGTLKKGTFPLLYRIYRIAIWGLVVGYITLIITYITNDNNIQSFDWYLRMVISESYRYLMIFILCINTIFIIAKYGDISSLLEKLSVILLASLIPTFCISFYLGCKGYRGFSDEMSMLPLYAYFSFVSFAIIDYRREWKSKIKQLGISLILLAIMLFRPSPLGGKWFLTIVIISGILLYKRINNKNPFILLFIILIVYLLVSIDLISILVSGNEYLEGKYEEAKMLLEVSTIATNIDNYEDSSPAFRIDEFINIYMEYVNDPIYALTGKGIIGTMLHRTSTSWDGIGSFSEVQQKSALFIQVHETLNVFFLKYGLCGLFAFVRLLTLIIKSCKFTFLGIIALLWFPFYFGVYQSMFLGASCTIVAISLIDLRNHNGKDSY